LLKVTLTEFPWQNEVPVKLGTESVGALTVMSAPLLLPIIAGVELTTRTRYVVPVEVLDGITTLLSVPEVAVELKVGVRDTGEEKEASGESCTVKTFPAVNVTLLELNGTLMVPPAQTVVEDTEPVVMVCEKTVKQVNKSVISRKPLNSRSTIVILL